MSIQAGSKEVVISTRMAELVGLLSVPKGAVGAIVFAHGSGSSRSSPRNQAIAQSLNRAGFATLLFDLLTDEEGLDRQKIFDIGLLSDRLIGATAWLCETETGILPLGFFGASTGAAAALAAAARIGVDIHGVVCRGGRPDMARIHLPEVTAPTLLIVGSKDEQVLALNRDARNRMVAKTNLVEVDNAGHLFEEPGALDKVASLAVDWFSTHVALDRLDP